MQFNVYKTLTYLSVSVLVWIYQLGLTEIIYTKRKFSSGNWRMVSFFWKMRSILNYSNVEVKVLKLGRKSLEGFDGSEQAVRKNYCGIYRETPPGKGNLPSLILSGRHLKPPNKIFVYMINNQTSRFKRCHKVNN